MTDKVVPIKPVSSSKNSSGESAKVLIPEEGKACTPLKPIGAGVKSFSNSPTPLKASGGTDPVPLTPMPVKSTEPVPLTAGDYKSILRDKYNYKVIENAGTIVFIHKKTGNISLIYFSDSERPERLLSEYTSTDSPLVTSGDNEHDNVLIEYQDETYPSPFSFDFLDFLTVDTRRPITLRPNLIHINNEPTFEQISVPEGWGYKCTWNISSFRNVKFGLLPPFDSCLNLMPYYFKDDDLSGLGLSCDIKLKGNPLEVTTRVVVDNKGDIIFSPFRVAYKGSKLDYGLFSFEYPIIRGINEIDNSERPNGIHDRNFMLLPRMEGCELCDPWNRLQADVDPFGKPNDPHALRVELDYPMDYGASMQFTAFYAKGVNDGIYLATHDDSLKAKRFIWEAYKEQNNDETTRQFSFSIVHFNDDICSGYKAGDSNISSEAFSKLLTIACNAFDKDDANPLRLKLSKVIPGFNQLDPNDSKEEKTNEGQIYPEVGNVPLGKTCIPIWKDYVNNDVFLTLSRLINKYSEIGWYDAADKYKEWARGSNGPIWAKTHRISRDNENRAFYKDTGLAVWLLGSEFHLSPSDNPSRNFIKAFHNVIAPEGLNIVSFDWPKMLFILGWDWHFPFDVDRYDDGRQYGNKKEYWFAHYGPPATSSAPCNITENLSQIKRQGDFALPYIFATRIYKPEYHYRWEGYLLNKSDDPGSPWINQEAIPADQQTRNPNWGVRHLCCATSAFKHFLINRDAFIRSGNLEPGNGNPRLDCYPDGVYHDVGFSFKGVRCFLCDPIGFTGKSNKDQSADNMWYRFNLHHHYSTESSSGFQVGTGGFINRAKRDILLENMYGQGGFASKARRKEIFGTESVTEVLIDAVDCSGCAETWGPYKPVQKMDNGEHKTIIAFKWIREYNSSEIPLLQYIYNPVMTLKLSGHVNLSGGRGIGVHPFSSHNVGTAFFWLLAKSYLSGCIVRLDYDLVPMDIMSTMDYYSDTYLLGWKRKSENPETVPEDHPINNDGSPVAGRHPISSERHGSIEFDKLHRTYSDIEKEKYVRMMAALRCRILPEYLVYGEMMRPGIIDEGENKIYDFDYDYYFDFHQKYENRTSDFNPPYYWSVPRLITAGWQSYPYLIGRPAPVVFIVANASPEKITNAVHLRVSFDNFGLLPSTCAYLHINPNEPKGWLKWNDMRPEKQIESNKNGVTEHTFTIPANKLGPKEIIVFKMTPMFTWRK